MKGIVYILYLIKDHQLARRWWSHQQTGDVSSMGPRTACAVLVACLVMQVAHAQSESLFRLGGGLLADFRNATLAAGSELSQLGLGPPLDYEVLGAGVSRPQTHHWPVSFLMLLSRLSLQPLSSSATDLLSSCSMSFYSWSSSSDGPPETLIEYITYLISLKLLSLHFYLLPSIFSEHMVSRLIR